MTAKKLYRSREDAMIGGVCAGLAEYFNIDTSLVRLATVILIFPGGLSFWAYIIAWIIIPQKPLAITAPAEGPESESSTENETAVDTSEEERVRQEDKSRYIVGIILVALGLIFLLNAFDVVFWFSFSKIWPIILIIIGIVVLYKAFNRGEKQ
jgi:phage shock protein C